MKVTIYGAGYVGLVTGVCLADVGHHVLCMDVDDEKIATLKQSKSPIHEPGLSDLLLKSRRCGRLLFSSDMAEAVGHSEIQMIAVGTPQDDNGSADLRFVRSVATAIGQHANQDLIVVNKSTVPVGSADEVKRLIESELSLRGLSHRISMVSNPEFLREGCAIEDFLKPDRIIIGTDSIETKKVMEDLYHPFSRNHYRLIFMDIRSAELTKYAANAMLAMKISFINEMALIADQVGADIENVRVGIGSDPRIGYSFIYPGCGYGGSCFPKDVKALIHMGEPSQPVLLQAVNERNTMQQDLLANKILDYFNHHIAGLKIAVWGLAFKAKTDDVREASSVKTIHILLEHGAEVHAYDPTACENARKIFAQKITYADDKPYDILDQADALVIHTEWKELIIPNLPLMAQKMRRQLIFDGRNLYDPDEVRSQGWTYITIGRNRLVSTIFPTDR